LLILSTSQIRNDHAASFSLCNLLWTLVLKEQNKRI